MSIRQHFPPSSASLQPTVSPRQHHDLTNPSPSAVPVQSRLHVVGEMERSPTRPPTEAPDSIFGLSVLRLSNPPSLWIPILCSGILQLDRPSDGFGVGSFGCLCWSSLQAPRLPDAPSWAALRNGTVPTALILTILAQDETQPTRTFIPAGRDGGRCECGGCCAHRGISRRLEPLPPSEQQL